MFLKENYDKVEALQYSHFNYNHLQFYNPCEVTIKNKNKTYTIFFTFSISYFLASLSRLCCLCLVQKILKRLSFKIRKLGEVRVSFSVFYEALDSLVHNRQSINMPKK